MAGPFQRRLWVPLIAGAAAFAASSLVPGSKLDRLFFTTVASTFEKGPLLVSGEGSHSHPWELRTLKSVAPDPKAAPLVVSVGDDTESVFQSSPPSPIDAALILKNSQRLGIKRLTCAAVLSWENPDTIALVALEKTMADFDSLVTAAPLSRVAVPSALPASFRHASLPVSAISGSTALLPIVNHLSVQNVILGDEKAWSGFTVLEADSGSSSPHLLARWEDRIVFALPLLAVMQQLDLPLEGMDITPGRYLKLGANGPAIPIDEYGRLIPQLKQVPAVNPIPAAALIDGTDDLLPKPLTAPFVIRDDQSASEISTREFSKNLASTIFTISSGDRISHPIRYQRLHAAWEVVILCSLAGAAFLLARLSPSRRDLGLLGVVVIAAGVHWIAAGKGHLWLPFLPFLSGAMGVAVAGRLLMRTPPAVPAVAPERLPENEPTPVIEIAPAPVVIAEPIPLIEKKQPKKQAVKKPPVEPAKKVASKPATPPPAKKTPAKKAASKKSAAKKAPRGKKRPPSSGS